MHTILKLNHTGMASLTITLLPFTPQPHTVIVFLGRRWEPLVPSQVTVQYKRRVQYGNAAVNKTLTTVVTIPFPYCQQEVTFQYEILCCFSFTQNVQYPAAPAVV